MIKRPERGEFIGGSARGIAVGPASYPKSDVAITGDFAESSLKFTSANCSQRLGPPRRRRQPSKPLAASCPRSRIMG